MFNLFLTPVYDTATAKKFCGSMNKEFGIDQEYSDRADQMLGHMDTLVKSFEEPGTDYTAAEEAIRTFLMQGGFSLFDDFGEAKHLQERLPIGIVCQKVKMFVAVMQQEVVAFVSLGTL